MYPPAGDTKFSAAFDTTGNITSRSGLGSYSYGQHNCAGTATSAPPHGVSQIGPAGNPRSERFCYDADGNRTRMQRSGIRQDITWTANGTPGRIITTRSPISGPRTYTVVKGDTLWGIARKFYGNGERWPAIYNANRHIIVRPNLIYAGQRLVIPADPGRQVRDALRSRTLSDTRLTYGPDGQLARQQATGPVDIRYFGPEAQWQSGRGLVKYYYFGTLLIARSDTTGTFYYQADQLGSPRTVTNSHGAVVARIKYDPWGAATVTSGRLPAGSPGFTGATPIAGTQYLQMGARLYDPIHGEFASADSLSPASADVQGANRYAYADNNPASIIDPSGHQGEDGGDGESSDTAPDDSDNGGPLLANGDYSWGISDLNLNSGNLRSDEPTASGSTPAQTEPETTFLEQSSGLLADGCDMQSCIPASFSPASMFAPAATEFSSQSAGTDQSQCDTQLQSCMAAPVSPSNETVSDNAAASATVAPNLPGSSSASNADQPGFLALGLYVDQSAYLAGGGGWQTSYMLVIGGTDPGLHTYFTPSLGTGATLTLVGVGGIVEWGTGDPTGPSLNVNLSGSDFEGSVSFSANTQSISFGVAPGPQSLPPGASISASNTRLLPTISSQLQDLLNSWEAGIRAIYSQGQ